MGDVRGCKGTAVTVPGVQAKYLLISVFLFGSEGTTPPPSVFSPLTRALITFLPGFLHMGLLMQEAEEQSKQPLVRTDSGGRIINYFTCRYLSYLQLTSRTRSASVLSLQMFWYHPLYPSGLVSP
jgi:hypothetical protein